jgi:ribulose-phosphate 3-epimerase
LEQIRHFNRLAGLAINPETDLAVIKNFAPFIDHIQIMGVTPGAQGRPYQEETPSRVRAIKKLFPQLTLGVDGGVTDENHIARALAAAGADDLAVGSAIWTANDPGRAYRDIAADAAI